MTSANTKFVSLCVSLCICLRRSLTCSFCIYPSMHVGQLGEFKQLQRHPMLRHCCLSHDCTLADSAVGSDDESEDVNVGDAPDAFTDDTGDGVFLCHSGHVAWNYSGRLPCDTCEMTFCRPCFLGTARREVDDVATKCVGCESSVAYVGAGPNPAPPLHGHHASILCAATRSSATAAMDPRCVTLLTKKTVESMLREHRIKPPKDDDDALVALQCVLQQKLPAIVADDQRSLDDLQALLETTEVDANVLESLKAIATERRDWPSPSVCPPNSLPYSSQSCPF